MSNPFVGTWTLKSTERKTLETGEVTPLWGAHPSGTLVYTAEGRMSALVLAESRKAPAAAMPTEAEALSLFKSMVAYAGRYTVDSDRVVHHVEQSWNQAWTGTDVVRFYKFDGNRLTLTTAPAPNPRDGKMSVSTLVWERVA
jgi:lipocalin-like protein